MACRRRGPDASLHPPPPPITGLVTSREPPPTRERCAAPPQRCRHMGGVASAPPTRPMETGMRPHWIAPPAALANGSEGGVARLGASARCRGASTNRRPRGRSPAGGTCGRARVRVGLLQLGRNRSRDGNGDSGTGTAAPGQRHRHRNSDTDIETLIEALGQAAPQKLNPGRGPSAEGPPPMEPSARSCSCGSPASSLEGPSNSEVEASGPLPVPPKPERSHKRPGGTDQAAPEMPSSPCGGKRPRKGEGGDAPPSDSDHLFAQKCQELQGFIHPLAELLEGLRQGRYDRGLSSFQQSVAMDRIQRIIGILQKPEMGARYLGTLLQVEGMLRVWFPHVTPKPVQDATPISALRRRPPAGPPGAPRCRRLPEDIPNSIPDGTASEASGTSHQEAQLRCHHPAQTGTPASPPPPDV